MGYLELIIPVNHLSPSTKPTFFTMEHINTSIGRSSLLIFKCLPVVRFNPNAVRNFASDAAFYFFILFYILIIFIMCKNILIYIITYPTFLSILFPNIKNGVVSSSFIVNNAINSFLLS